MSEAGLFLVGCVGFPALVLAVLLIRMAFSENARLKDSERR